MGSPMESDQGNYSADAKTDVPDIYGLLYKNGPETPLMYTTQSKTIILATMVDLPSPMICANI